MPVCIVGMHRSGTSMVANLLHGCGLYLGHKKELMPPTEDNRRGYWENLHFVEVNKKILSIVGGDWDLPPTLSVHEWKEHPDLLKFKPKVLKLISKFEKNRPWGWKDPRTNFTLPYWQALIPDLKLVLCLRNPLEVNRSLRARRHSPHPLGLILWRVQNQFLLTHSTPAQRIITQYDNYFARPRTELERVLNFVRLDAKEDTLRNCMSIISASDRHHYVSGDIMNAHAPTEVRKLYEQMCEEAI